MAIEGSYFDTPICFDCRKAYLLSSDPPTLRKFTFADDPKPEPEPEININLSKKQGMYTNLTFGGRYCERCKADWQGPEISPTVLKNYAPGVTHYSRLIGIEVRGGYDGVSYWQCPDCGATWNRFTGEYCPDGAV